MSEREQLLMQLKELEEKEDLSKSERKRRARLQHKLELLDLKEEQERIQYEKDVFFMKKQTGQDKIQTAGEIGLTGRDGKCMLSM